MFARVMLRRQEFAVLLYFATAASLFATTVPVFEAPDEPFHLDYVNHLLANREIPNQLDESRRVFREGHQPPLYYALAALVTLPIRGGETVGVELERNPEHVLGGGTSRGVPYYAHTPAGPFREARSRFAFYSLRALGVGLGLLNLLLVLRVASRFLPTESRWFAAALVATLPQFLFISASVNNDNLSNLVSTAVILAALQVLAQPERMRNALILGSLLGLGLCVKKTDMALIPPVALLFMWLIVRDPELRGRVLRNAAAAGAALIAVGGWVLLRNLVLYGDPLGTAMERATLHFIVNDQSLFSPYFRGIFWSATLGSFVGIFGWMQVPLPFAALAFWWALMGGGIVAATLFAWNTPALRAPVALGIGFWVSCFAGVVYYNTTFPEPQGRFLFPVIAVTASLIALGVVGTVRRFAVDTRSACALLLVPAVAIDIVALLRISRFY